MRELCLRGGMHQRVWKGSLLLAVSWGSRIELLSRSRISCTWRRASGRAEQPTMCVTPTYNISSLMLIIHDVAMCRRAQRKFRERQKQKLADSEGKAIELRKELEQLRVEKSKLETRNALLEKLVRREGGGASKDSGALSTFSDRDSAREETPRRATQGSQMVHLTVREGGAFSYACLDRLKPSTAQIML